MGLTGTRSARAVVLTVLALVALRLVCAALTPLTFDEAYYWTWSKHLAGGYYDHPPLVAIVIRLGTMIAGDTEFGVRLVSILLALPMSFAVYRATVLLFDSARAAATATVLLNVMLMVAAGTVIVTPDAPLMAASSFVLLCLAELLATGRRAWWLAVGAAVGAALVSKYTALFFGPVILIWLLAVPELRRWLRSPWPYLGGLVALAIFSPVVIWNADHHWVSFAKQFGRARVDQFTLRYIIELIPTQIAFATPPVFVLAAMGLFALSKRDEGTRAARALISATVWTLTIYFVWHSLHARVEANWFGPIYPALAVAAAVAADVTRWKPRGRHIADVCRRWAVPVGVAMLVALVVQVNTGLLSGYRRDASVRSVGVGWRGLATEIEAVRAKTGARCVLAQSYGVASWLRFYLPKDTCVVQRFERIRWINGPQPAADQLTGKLLYVDDGLEGWGRPARYFNHVEKVATLERKRGPLTVETFEIDVVADPKGDVLEPLPAGLK
ncbi:glycosyl transferase, family 39 [Nitrobacter hamburgensis X14]|uniref:Glycosyl transferase, family 39 n=1 Tax=Nitrobacter hamburgensis (strain DSM 10229 / NCIMB 13809 / X14) TaxID=323097 RepID=Q1QK68_NITHX|nr:glycosyltransferase family 39 protein [Nitrobacter hamburgensis]ABE63379.1 glycosyl transferase, family 39 [Nitrobacter hamburgensis X14]